MVMALSFFASGQYGFQYLTDLSVLSEIADGVICVTNHVRVQRSLLHRLSRLVFILSLIASLKLFISGFAKLAMVVTTTYAVQIGDVFDLNQVLVSSMVSGPD